jgi:hypothetical protein
MPDNSEQSGAMPVLQDVAAWNFLHQVSRTVNFLSLVMWTDSTTIKSRDSSLWRLLVFAVRAMRIEMNLPGYGLMIRQQ